MTRGVSRSFDQNLRLLVLAAIAAVLAFLTAQILLENILLGLTLLAPALILIVARGSGVRWSLGIALSSVMLYDFLCLFAHVLRGSDPAALALGSGCVLFAAYAAGRLSSRMREQQLTHAEQATREKQLSDISTHLLTASSEVLLCRLTLRHLYDVTRRPSIFYVFPGGVPQCVQRYPDGLICYPTEDRAAYAAFSSGKQAGFGTGQCRESAFLYLPVHSGSATLAVVGLLCDWTAPPDGYLIETVEMILVRVGVALDNQRLFRQQQSILMEKELEHIRTDFLRAISHDFRTPLTGIIGACTALSDDDVTLDAADRRTLVDSIGEEAAWLLRMVENLLSVTRVGSSGPKLHKKPEPIEEVLSAVLERTHKRFPTLQVHIREPGKFLMVPMDATLIMQVLMNLIENAAKYSGPERVIDVIAEDRPHAVAFTVRDYGHGLSEERLGDPFSPATLRAGDSHHGMGLGLSICHSVVAAHGGTIEAGNDPSGGAVFTFTLPKEEEHE